MYMAYSNNPHLPRIRMDAVKMVKQGNSIRSVARHFGFSHGAVMNWLKKEPERGLFIPTLSSRPEHHPRELTEITVSEILKLRSERNQCAEILRYRLQKEKDIIVSLSSVKRILKRHNLSKFSRWKKWHQYPMRPMPKKPGILVEIDTVHDGEYFDRLYIYTMIDVCSRWTYVLPVEKISTHKSLSFVKDARLISPFEFQTLQSDHGSEFSLWFSKRINENGLIHRHSRVRTPTDNGHLERFNRTLQEECLNRVPRDMKSYQKAIIEYLHYYNFERPHMALNYQTPMEVVRSY